VETGPPAVTDHLEEQIQLSKRRAFASARVSMPRRRRLGQGWSKPGALSPSRLGSGRAGNATACPCQLT